MFIGDDMLMSTFSESQLTFIPARGDTVRQSGEKFKVVDREFEYHVPVGITATLYLERI